MTPSCFSVFKLQRCSTWSVLMHRLCLNNFVENIIKNRLYDQFYTLNNCVFSGLTVGPPSFTLIPRTGFTATWLWLIQWRGRPFVMERKVSHVVALFSLKGVRSKLEVSIPNVTGKNELGQKQRANKWRMNRWPTCLLGGSRSGEWNAREKCCLTFHAERPDDVARWFREATVSRRSSSETMWRLCARAA